MKRPPPDPQKRRAPGEAPSKNDLQDSTAGSNLSTELCAEIRAEYGRLVRGTLESARRLGELLKPIRELLKHGQWELFVKQNFPFSPRTAREFMQIADEWPRLAADMKSADLADLPRSVAVKLLAKPKTEEIDYELPTFTNMQQMANGCELPNLLDMPTDRGAVWIAPHDAGLLILTPSQEHPGHVFIDDVNTVAGWSHVARRPMKLDAMRLFYPGSVWLHHSECQGSIGLLLNLAPERAVDCAALGIHEEVPAAA